MAVHPDPPQKCPLPPQSLSPHLCHFLLPYFILFYLTNAFTTRSQIFQLGIFSGIVLVCLLVIYLQNATHIQV